MEKNIFERNSAKFEGGVIKWIENEPLIYENNIFINNSAIYGDINAAFPFRIIMGYSQYSKEICHSNQYKNCYIQIENIASGSPLNISFVFSIKDIYNKTITSLNDGFLYNIF